MTEQIQPDHLAHYGAVYRYIRRRTRNREDAEDVTQTVFADAASGERSAELSFGPGWLYTVARRRLIDHARHRERELARRVVFDESSLGSVSHGSSSGNLAQILMRNIAALPHAQREVVEMKIIQGRKFAEIARQLGISEEACRARLSRALRILRSELQKEGVEP